MARTSRSNPGRPRGAVTSTGGTAVVTTATPPVALARGTPSAASPRPRARRGSLGTALALALAAGIAGACSPACSEGDERRLARDVELVVGTEGRVAEDAARRLVEVGRRAIPSVEIGLYQADAAGRRRLAALLGRLGPEARPVLEHLARRDPDPDVRATAAAALGRTTP